MYDIELLLTELLDLVGDNLDAKLDALDAEKNDGVVLKKIPAEAYFFQTLDEKAAAYDAFVYFGIENPVAISNGPYTAEEVKVQFAVVLKKTAEGDVYQHRILRYQRALKEIFQDGWSKNRGGCKLSISSFSPSDFGIHGSNDTFTGIGVQVKTVIG